MNKLEIGMSYRSFLRLTDFMKAHLKELDVTVRVYLPDAEYEKLSKKEKESLKEYERLNLDLSRPAIPATELFKGVKGSVEEMNKAQSFQIVAERPKQKFYVPRKIGTVCTKKKGGR